MNRLRVLLVISNGFEELEALAPVDFLRRAEVEVVLASMENNLEVEGRNQIKVIADCFFEDVAGEDFAMIVVPGGPSHLAMMKNEALLERLQKQKANGDWIASICAGPKVLHAADLIGNAPFTCHSSAIGDLPETYEDQAVVQSGRLITSQGAGTATVFALALVEALKGKVVRDEVAESIGF